MDRGAEGGWTEGRSAPVLSCPILSYSVPSAALLRRDTGRRLPPALPPLCVTARAAAEAAGKAGREAGVKAAAGPCQAGLGRAGLMELGGESGCWFLYFAYGSNLLRERLLLRNPSAALCALARLQVREGAAGGAAGGLREPYIPAGSPGAPEEPRVPAAGCGAVLQPVRPSHGGGPSTDQAGGPGQGDGAGFCTLVPSDRTKRDGRKLKQKKIQHEE